MNKGKADATADRSFEWLNATQFLGVLNDNIFKLLAIFFLIGKDMSPSAAVASIGAVFVIPFLALSQVGGVLADRFSRSRMLALVKSAEIAVMALGCAMLYSGSIPGLFAACVLMAAQSALFSPIKFSLLSELVPKDRLARANGALVAMAYAGVILGTPTAAFLSYITHRNFGLAAIPCLLIAIAGTLVSSRIRHVPAVGKTGLSPGSLLPTGVWSTLKTIRSDTYLYLAVLSSAYFVFLATFMQLNLIPYGIHSFSLTQEQSSYIFLLAAAGVGISAVVAGKLSNRNIEFGLVPLAATGLFVSCAMLFLLHNLVAALAITVLVGISVGFFTVPIDAFTQMRAPREHIGRVMATCNLLSYSGILLASALIFITEEMIGLSAAQAFLVVGILTLVLVAGTILVLPDFLVRFIIIVFARMVYRVKVAGIENLPVEGGAMLCPNHVALTDALLVSVPHRRRIRFVMLREAFDHSVIFKPLFRLMKAVPISEKDPPRKLVAALKQARRMMDDGFLVCVFPEGQLTRTGHLAEFKPGIEHIMRGSTCPIIPVYIGGAWGSMFSHAHGKPMSTFPRRIPYPVTVIFGRPLPPDTPAWRIRLAVSELSAEWFNLEKAKSKSLGELFARSARRNWSRDAIADSTGKKLTFGKTLIAATILADKLRDRLKDQDKVGIVMPAVAGGVLANAAVTILGKTTVNLNFTASEEAVSFAAAECGLKTVITSRKFMENLKDFKCPGDFVYLEDIMKTVTGGDKVKALLKARFAPPSVFSGTDQFDPDSLATVIYSSGTTGRPKGAMLSHYNLVSNMEAFGMVLRFRPDDVMCAALPFFHSFGFTCTLWFPFIVGFRAFYHPNPLEGDRIAQVIRENRATVLLATPTFLQTYTRRAKREDFQSLRFVITGAEKLRDKTADAFQEKFGVLPLQGYGVTELAPVVSVNIPDVSSLGITQAGSRKGTIGQAIPGCAAKTVGADETTPLPPGEEGLLLIKGPNVMLGYLKQPELTAAAIKDGWYITGDIAKIDAEGFMTITDRASRFSKIGGEMVPHIAIEDAYLEKLSSEERCLAVTSVPDEKKGERLLVFFTDAAGTAESLHALISRSPLPNLWKPRLEDHIRVESLPMMGSGKMDLKGLKAMAAEIQLRIRNC